MSKSPRTCPSASSASTSNRRGVWIAALSAVALLSLACGAEHGDRYEVSGVIEKIDPEAAQLLIAHDPIPGYMPAMTMNFDVEDPKLLEGLSAGARVHFDLHRTGSLLTIRAIHVVGHKGEAGLSGVGGVGPLVPKAKLDPAPDFTLTNHEGREFTLSSLQPKAVLLDFIFTRCPGPCPILTAAHASLQRKFSDELQNATHLVSVSIDPSYDSPKRLRAYGETRGADLEHWTFLTGEPAVIADVLKDYYVGTVRQDDGTLEHIVITYLIDPQGRIAERYIGLDVTDHKIIDDLERVLAGSS